MRDFKRGNEQNDDVCTMTQFTSECYQNQIKTQRQFLIVRTTFILQYYYIQNGGAGHQSGWSGDLGGGQTVRFAATILKSDNNESLSVGQQIKQNSVFLFLIFRSLWFAPFSQTFQENPQKTRRVQRQYQATQLTQLSASQLILNSVLFRLQTLYGPEYQL